MRAHEFINEGRKARKEPKSHSPKGAKKSGNALGGRKHKKPRKEYEYPMQGVAKSRDVGGYDRIYHANRLAMAMAMADGQSTSAVDMDESSWNEKFNTMHPYTKEEANMIASAVNTIPTEFDQISDWSRSQESPGGNTKSLMIPFSGYTKKSKKKK
jgi:hypothetical protein